MKIWAISDTHFADTPGRTMEIYGPVWRDHEITIARNWRQAIGHGDIVLVGGDISWARKLDRGLIHLRKISDLPGKAKVIVKGNHDHWWTGQEKLVDRSPSDIIPLDGHAVKIDEHVFCGIRGWLAPNDPCTDALDGNTFRGEMKRLKEALEEAMTLNPKEGIHLLMHFPPFTTHGEETPFFQLIKKYPVVTCSYGHFHMEDEWKNIPKGTIDGIQCNLTATDFLKHKPSLIWEN